MSDADLLRRQLALIDAGIPCATVQIVRVNGSIPNEIGARMLVTHQGDDARATLVAGTVGGGKIEYDALLQAAQALSEERSCLVSAKLTEQEAGGIGMMCGGQVDLFIEVHLPQHRLVLCGAGHINIALARMAKGLGFRVTVLDDRPEWACAEHYPDLRPGHDLLVVQPEVALADLGLDSRSYVVVGTRSNDTETIVAASKTPARYIGVVASKRKAIRIIKELAARGTAAEADTAAREIDLASLIPRFYGPIGLSLGGRSPEAVALSILAEVQAHRYGLDASPMRVAPDELARLLEKARGDLR